MGLNAFYTIEQESNKLEGLKSPKLYELVINWQAGVMHQPNEANYYIHYI